MPEVNNKCTLKNDLVTPCQALESIIDTNPLSSAKGVAMWELTNLETHEPSRSFVGIKTKQHKKGLVFNYCPFCGEEIYIQD